MPGWLGLGTRLADRARYRTGGRIASSTFAVLLALFASSSSIAGEETFLPAGQSPSDSTSTESICRQGSQTLWVNDGKGAALCLRYYRSEAGGPGPLALVVFADHQTVVPPHEHAERDSAVPDNRAGLMALADGWSRLAHEPVILLARPGAFGSSGESRRDTGTNTEVGWMASALDQLKSRLALKGFNLTGVGSGGNLAATLGLIRRDIACVVAGGAWLSERDRLAETGELFAPAKLRTTNDPMTAVTRSQPRRQLRVIALADPADPNTPDSALTTFADAAGLNDIRFHRIALPALASTEVRADQTIRTAIGCASGEPDVAIETLVRKPVEAAQLPVPVQPPVPKPIGDLILPQIEPRDPIPAIPTLKPTTPQATPAPVSPQKPIPVGPQPPTPAAQIKPEDITFGRADLLYGKSIDEPTCAAMPFSVWVTSVGNPECIRYYYSDAGGVGLRTLLFLNGDFTYRGVDGQPTVDPDYTRLSASDLQRIAEVRSRDYGGPMIYLARPGTLGSSGYELLVRHSPREVALVAAAIAEIKRRHGIETFDLVGHSGGGLLVGALVSQRSDIGCAVTSSGVLATNAWTSQRLNLPQTNSGFLYDPLEHVSEIRPGPGFRYILLTDPADTTVSASSTQLYLDALASAGIPHTHIELTAADDAHHDLALHGFRAAIGCAHGMSDADITALLTRTIVTNRRMSELSPLGDMLEQAVDDKPSPAPFVIPKKR